MPRGLFASWSQSIGAGSHPISRAAQYLPKHAGDRAQGEKGRGEEQDRGLRSAAFGKVGGTRPATGGLDDVGLEDVGSGDDGRHALAFFDLRVKRYVALLGRLEKLV